MARHCISCKREISKAQKECYICGASQSYLSFHKKTLVVFLILVSASAVLGYQYSEHRALEKAQNEADLLDAQSKSFAKKLASLELQLAKALQKAADTQETLNTTSTNATNANDAITQANLKVKEAEQKTTKAEGRANWLNKENRRFKAEIKSLTDKLSEANQRATVSNSAQLNAASKVEALVNPVPTIENLEQPAEQKADDGDGS